MIDLPLILYGLLIAPLLLILYAQHRVQRVFREEDQIENAEQITGLETARELLNEVGLYQVKIEILSGRFTDQYDPTTKILRLSPGVARRDTRLAVGVAGHEVGHAIQDAENYSLMRAHKALARWLIVLTTLSPIAFIGGFLFGNIILMFVALGIVALQVIFALVTLPLERNASKRALQLLRGRRVITGSESDHVQRVLRAAANTYLAAAGVRIVAFIFWFVLVAAATNIGRGRIF